MGSLGRLLVLALLVAIVVAKKRGGRRRRPPPQESMASGEVWLEIGKDLGQMMMAGCLPDGFTTPDLSNCEGENGEQEMLECLAKSAGFADESGYNQITSEAFIDKLSSEEQWNANSKEKLGDCSSMMQMTADLPVDKQGVFMFSCWYKLEKVMCDVQRVAYALHNITSEGIAIGVGIAHFAEGSCITSGLKQPESVEKWKECALTNELNFDLLMDAGKIYKKYIGGSDDRKELTEENVIMLGEQLSNFNDTVHCTMQAVGEITDDGELNFDQMRENIDNSRGTEYIKAAARGILTHCEKQNSATPDMFVSCWFATQPYACTSVMARELALSPEEKAGAGCGTGGGGRRRGGKQRRRRNNRGGKGRRNNKRKQQQPDKEVVEA